MKNLIEAWINDNAFKLLAILYKNDFWYLRNRLRQKHCWFKRMLYDAILSRNGAWIGIKTEFATPPCLPHGLSGIFISRNSKIGKNVVIFHQVTIGSNSSIGSKNGSPVIGDDVYIGAGAKIIGNVKIGDGCRIGANAIVTQDVPPNSVCVNRGLEIITRDKKMDNRFVIPKQINLDELE